jgi:ribonuclease/clavin/mitogillin
LANINIYKTKKPPITYPVNHYVLKIGNTIYQIDAGSEPLKYESYTPDYVLITHWHWDHTYGLTGAKNLDVCIPRKSLDLLEPGRSLERVKNIILAVEGEEAWERIKPIVEIFIGRYKEINIAIKEQNNPIPLEECPPIVKGEVSYIECPGHSEDHVCYFIDGKAFTGDNMAPGWNITLIDPLSYISSLYRLMTMDWFMAYPGHGEPLDRNASTKYIAEIVSSKIKRMCRTAASIENRSRISKLMKKIYNEDLSEVMRYVAARSLIGYLKNLESLGIIRIHRESYPWLVEKV